jgi:hypothetical protein
MGPGPSTRVRTGAGAGAVTATAPTGMIGPASVTNLDFVTGMAMTAACADPLTGVSGPGPTEYAISAGVNGFAGAGWPPAGVMGPGPLLSLGSVPLCSLMTTGASGSGAGGGGAGFAAGTMGPVSLLSLGWAAAVAAAGMGGGGDGVSGRGRDTSAGTKTGCKAQRVVWTAVVTQQKLPAHVYSYVPLKNKSVWHAYCKLLPFTTVSLLGKTIAADGNSLGLVSNSNLHIVNPAGTAVY